MHYEHFKHNTNKPSQDVSMLKLILHNARHIPRVQTAVLCYRIYR